VNVGVAVVVAGVPDEVMPPGTPAGAANGPFAGGATTKGAGATLSAALQPGPVHGTGGSSQVSHNAQPDDPTANNAASFQRRDRDIGGFLSIWERMRQPDRAAET